jgi:hypothetical protein
MADGFGCMVCKFGICRYVIFRSFQSEKKFCAEQLVLQTHVVWSAQIMSGSLKTLVIPGHHKADHLNLIDCPMIMNVMRNEIQQHYFVLMMCAFVLHIDVHVRYS